MPLPSLSSLMQSPTRSSASLPSPSSPRAESPVLLNGCALPYGATATLHGTNFAIYAREPTTISLLLFRPAASSAENSPDRDPDKEFKLNPKLHRTGHVWHVEVRPSVAGWSYLWRVGDRVDPRWRDNLCLDPWAVMLDSPVGPRAFNDRVSGPENYRPRAVVPSPSDLEFDWESVPRPRIPWKDLTVYELHVRGFSNDTSAGGQAQGTFLGIVERIPYLKSLGVNCVELLPVQEFNEKEWSHVNPVTNKKLCQFWGYSTVAFFAPMNRYGRNGSSPVEVIRDFKIMVRELHRAGIEVILDVVYNHTAEMGLDFLPPGHYGMKTLAPFSYYILQENGAKFVNHSGCGNTVNCNNPVVQELICDSLRYWAHTMGVDGFRFDLSSVLCRDTTGAPMERPPVIERMTKDPTMRDIKLIAEPWDCGGLYLVGRFPHYGAWAEWNGKYRDCIRRFIKGDSRMVAEFATRICGSQDLYGDGRKPYHSINFVTAHDGFSLRDLVSYNSKHNEHNGENNNDGESHNNSWNCGVEGDTDNGSVVNLRLRQMKNMLVALMVSTGTPMICMGDEYAHTKQGNNNCWCQDSTLSWFSWKEAAAQKSAILRFTKKLLWLRRQCSTLRRGEFLSSSDVSWHGTDPNSPNWNSPYNFIAFTLHGHEEFFVAFNAGNRDQHLHLPKMHGIWHRVVDTSLESPRDFSENSQHSPIADSTYRMAPYSSIIMQLLKRSDPEESVEVPGSEFVDGFSLKSLVNLRL